MNEVFKGLLAVLVFSLLTPPYEGFSAQLDLVCPEGRSPLFECPSVREVKVVRMKVYGSLRTEEVFEDSLLCGLLGVSKDDEPITMNLFTRHLWNDYRVEGEDHPSYFESENFFITEIDGLLDPKVRKLKLGFSWKHTTYSKKHDKLEVHFDKDAGTADFRLQLERQFLFNYRQEIRIVYEDCVFSF